MLSKSLIRLFVIICVFTACSQESIERHQTRTNEDDVTYVTDEVTTNSQGTQEFSQYNEDHQRIDEMIESGELEKLSQALKELDQQLFAPIAEDPVMYTSAMYVGYLNLYVKLFKTWEDQQGVQPFGSEMLSSLEKFNQWFVASCVDEDVSNCEKLKESLMKARSAVAIVNYFIKQEEDQKKKLALAGLAYDLSGRREEATLNSLYIEALMNVLSSEEEGESVLPIDELRVHTINLVALFNSYNWAENKQSLSDLFKSVKPWELKQPVVSSLDIVRAELIQFLPVYAERDSSVKDSINAHVAAQIDEIQEGTFDLSQYPAYDNIDLNSLKNEDTLVTYLLLGVYYQTIEVTSATQFLSQMSDPGAASEKVYELSKKLIQWDVAQLSIDSTKKLAEQFMAQEVKTKTFVEDVLSYSKQLVPAWTSFHSVRLFSIRRFVNSTIPQMPQISGTVVREFYASINRNILKTTVYPNMLAFMYHMAKTEWQAQIRIWFWTFDLDTTDIFDFMMTGNYYYPWFNFTNLAEDAGYNDDTRVSLFRSEIMDSFYYLLATKTAEEYAVDIDDMIKVVSDTVLKKRVRPFREVLESQRRVYYTEGQSTDQFIEWCQALKRGEKTKEDLQFYKLYEQVLGHSQKLANVEEIFNDGALLFAHLPLFYNDKYDRGHGAIPWELTEITDRFRNEILPILSMSNQMVNIAKRLDAQYPALVPPLTNANAYLEEFHRFKQTYLGMQMSISERMGDCPQVAGRESRRRMRQIAFAEKDYQSKIVQPLMAAAMSGEITVEEANQVLKSVHENHEGFIDSIVVMNEDVATYKSSWLNFAMRMRIYLISGVTINHPVTGDVEIQPIVGNSLEINLPPAVLSEQGRNPYFNGNGNLRPWREFSYYKGGSAENYAETVIPQLMDEMRGSFSKYKFTKVDRTESTKYFEIDSKRVEFMVQKLMMNGESYIDYNNTACRSTGDDLPEECFKTVSASVDGLADLMHDIFKNVEIDEEIEEYMGLIAHRGYVGHPNVGVQLRFSDAIAEHPDYDYANRIIPYKDLGGFFDLAIDFLRNPHLGFMALNEYESYLVSNSEHGGYTCSMARNGCYWEDSKVRAKQFFLAREKRPGMIFKFDKEILVESYEENKKGSKISFDYMFDIENRGQALIEQRRQGQLDIYFDTNRPIQTLFPLSTNRTNNQYDFDKFFKEETESFYLEEPNWDQYLMSND